MPPQVTEDSSPRQTHGLEVGLFVFSVVLLSLEVLETKIFSFTLDRISIYTAIGICQLGLGAGATALALARRPDAEAGRRWTLRAGLAAALAIPASHALFAATSHTISRGGWLATLTLIALTTPYFFLGIAIASVLVARAAAIGRTYAVNLAGSAAGCAVVFPLLDGLGAERTVLALGALTLAGASTLARSTALRAAGLAGAAALAAWIAAVPTPGWILFRPDPDGQLALVMKSVENLRKEHPGGRIELEHLLARWDRTTRVDVYRLDTDVPELQSRMDGTAVPALSFMQDADAGSFLVGVGDDLSRARPLYEETVYGAGYVARPVRDVMIIGLGGAPDLLTALYYGAEHIDAVEINRTTIEIARDDFREFLGDPYGRPEVNVRQMDGRAFLRQTDRTYDLIQMSGVDTKSILPSGSLAINENYVYTVEAMRDILRRLEPDGILSFIRVGDHDANRLSSIAVEGLREVGAAQPERHVFVIAQGWFRAVLVKRSPFTGEELGALHGWIEEHRDAPPAIRMPTHEMILLDFQNPMQVQYSPVPLRAATTPFFQALGAGSLDAFVERARLDYRAPVDDRPFFFLRNWPSDLLLSPPPAVTPLYRFLAELGAVSVASILLPLALLRRRGLAAPGAGGALLYFFCLGAGFMLIEIGLIQRFVLFLGHQSYAITVVIFSLLLGAGAGSLWSPRLPAGSARPLRVVIALLLLLVALYGIGLQWLFEVAGGADLGVRVALSVALLVALGFLLGMPFPTAMRSLDRASPALVPWAIGVNAFASVFGSTLAIPVAMVAGLRAVLAVGLLLYALASATAPIRAAGDG